MSASDRSQSKKVPYKNIEASLQAARSGDLHKVLIDNCGYSSKPFASQKAHRMKEFCLCLLTELELTFGEFAELSPEQQQATAATTNFPPEDGAETFFAVPKIVCRCDNS